MISLEALLAQDGIQLHGSGKNLSAKCPFHDDKAPSLSVNIEEGVYNCHGCGAKGNAKTYLIAAHGLSEFEAAARLRSDSPNPRPKRKAEPPKVYPTLPSKRISQHPYQDKDGNTLWVVCRFPEGLLKKDGAPHPKCTQHTPVKGGWIGQGAPQKPASRPLYRLPKLLTADPKQQVMVVEGEKCVESVEKTFGRAVVTTWCGGTNSRLDFTDWSPLHGRPILLVSDEDDVGRHVMLKLVEILSPHCPKIRVVMPSGDTADDIHDWIERDGADGARAKLAALAVDAPTPAPSPDPEPDGDTKKKSKKPAATPPPLNTGGLDKNSYFSVLGNVGDTVAIMLSTHRMLLCSRTSLTQASTLVSLADFHWWLMVTSQNSLTAVVCQQIGSTLIRTADRMGQINPDIFIGRGCFRYKEKAAWHLGDRMLVDGKTVGLNDLPGVMPVAGPRIAVSAEKATKEDRHRLAKAMLRYRWEHPNHCKRFMGWIVAAAVGGALDWRPHVWLSAPASAGKSWLIKTVIRPILGDLLIHAGDPSAAGLARAVRSDAVAVVFDEAEATASQLDAVMDLARIASGGDGSRIRADMGTSSGFDVLKLRFSLMLSSVMVAMMKHANASRFCSVRLSSQPVADWPSVADEIRIALERPERILAAIVEDATQIVDLSRHIEKTLIDQGVGSRAAAIEAALSSGWAWMSGEIERVMDEEYDDTMENISDGADLLRFLIGIRIRVGVDEQSVGRILQNDDDKKVARDYGFRMENDTLRIAPRHPSLVERLSKSRWAGVDLHRTLMQLDRVEKSLNPISFGAVKTRAIIVPREVCEELGINIFETERLPL